MERSIPFSKRSLSFKTGNNNWLTDILWLGNNLFTCEAAASGSINLKQLSYDLSLPKNSKNFNSMFRNCGLTTLPDNFNLRYHQDYSPITVSSMFEGCSSLLSIPDSFVLTDNNQCIRYTLIENCLSASESKCTQCSEGFELNEKLNSTPCIKLTCLNFSGLFLINKFASLIPLTLS